MSRPGLVVWLASSVALGGCNIAGLVGGGSKHEVVSVTVLLPAGILVGDSVQATAVATDASGNVTNNAPATWRSSDATAVSVDAHGRVKGLIGGRQATIFAAVESKTGSATISVASDDSRFGYALADQPTAAGPNAPDASYRYNSSGGAITVTRASTGLYSVRFAGLGRAPGDRDNLQVSSYGGSALYCKPHVWDASGTDLVVDVGCFSPDGTSADSRFTVLVMGARAFGTSTPVGFALSLGDTGTVVLDTSATARNSTGDHIYVGRGSEGQFTVEFTGLGAASGGGPLGLQLTPVGGPRHCIIGAYDLTSSQIGIQCARPGGGRGDAPFSVLWLTRGRPGLRFGYAYANDQNSSVEYTPDPILSASSSGGTITSRRTAVGQYRVVFAGLARPPGATEIVQVSPFGGQAADICTIVSWGNSGANDLAVTVACFDHTGTPINRRFNILVIE